jgi:hypothetical protein
LASWRGDLVGMLEDQLLGGAVDDGGAAERSWVDNPQVMESLLDRS